MRAVFLLLAAALCCGNVHAQVPRQINYQGLLTNPGGTPVTATVAMEFRLYAVASGPDAPLYSETQNNVAVANGAFSVLIGSVTPIPGSVLFDQPYYLGVKVGADNEMTPRPLLAASPYALRAASATTADALAAGATEAGSQITGARLVDVDRQSRARAPLDGRHRQHHEGRQPLHPQLWLWQHFHG